MFVKLKKKVTCANVLGNKVLRLVYNRETKRKYNVLGKCVGENNVLTQAHSMLTLSVSVADFFPRFKWGWRNGRQAIWRETKRAQYSFERNHKPSPSALIGRPLNPNLGCPLQLQLNQSLHGQAVRKKRK